MDLSVIDNIPGRNNSQTTLENSTTKDKVIVNVKYVAGYYTVVLHLFPKGNYIGDYSFPTGLKRKKYSLITKLREEVKDILKNIEKIGK